MIGFYSVLNFLRLQKVSNQSDGAADIPVVQRRESHVSLAREGRRGNDVKMSRCCFLVSRRLLFCVRDGSLTRPKLKYSKKQLGTSQSLLTKENGTNR